MTRPPPIPDLEQLRALAADVPTPGPWRRYRGYDGALILEDVVQREPVVLVYAALSTALYLEACAPSTLFRGGL